MSSCLNGGRRPSTAALPASRVSGVLDSFESAILKGNRARTPRRREDFAFPCQGEEARMVQDGDVTATLPNSI